jgi:hypothetical protein
VQRWLGVLDQVRELTSFEALQSRLDTLARTFVARIAGGAFDDLADKAKLGPALQKVRDLAELYARLDDRLVALVDLYLDPATKRAAEGIESALGELSELEPDHVLKGRVDPRLWQVLQLLGRRSPPRSTPRVRCSGRSRSSPGKPRASATRPTRVFASWSRPRSRSSA